MRLDKKILTPYENNPDLRELWINNNYGNIILPHGFDLEFIEGQIFVRRTNDDPSTWPIFLSGIFVGMFMLFLITRFF